MAAKKKSTKKKKLKASYSPKPKSARGRKGFLRAAELDATSPEPITPSPNG